MGKTFQNHRFCYFQLCLENRCHIFVVYILFQVIKHISTDLKVYIVNICVSTTTYVTGKMFVLHRSLLLLSQFIPHACWLYYTDSSNRDYRKIKWPKFLQNSSCGIVVLYHAKLYVNMILILHHLNQSNIDHKQLI